MGHLLRGGRRRHSDGRHSLLDAQRGEVLQGRQEPRRLQMRFHHADRKVPRVSPVARLLQICQKLSAASLDSTHLHGRAQVPGFSSQTCFWRWQRQPLRNRKRLGSNSDKCLETPRLRKGSSALGAGFSFEYRGETQKCYPGWLPHARRVHRWRFRAPLFPGFTFGPQHILLLFWCVISRWNVLRKIELDHRRENKKPKLSSACKWESW